MSARIASRIPLSPRQEDVFEEEYSDHEESSGGRSQTRAPITRSLSGIQNRANKFRAHRGISQDCIDENEDEQKTEDNLRAMTELKDTTNQEYSCNSMSRLRRVHLAELDGFEVGEQDSEKEASAHTVKEKKRRAQDVLLGQQLRLGVIPEQLLRKIPRMGDLISLDLSHYGMGDSLCICLGKR
jgi:hypothetical protein